MGLPDLGDGVLKTRMNDQSWKRKEGKEPCPGLALTITANFEISGILSDMARI